MPYDVWRLGFVLTKSETFARGHIRELSLETKDFTVQIKHQKHQFAV